MRAWLQGSQAAWAVASLEGWVVDFPGVDSQVVAVEGVRCTSSCCSLHAQFEDISLQTSTLAVQCLRLMPALPTYISL